MPESSGPLFATSKTTPQFEPSFIPRCARFTPIHSGRVGRHKLVSTASNSVGRELLTLLRQFLMVTSKVSSCAISSCFPPPFSSLSGRPPFQLSRQRASLKPSDLWKSTSIHHRTIARRFIADALTTAKSRLMLRAADTHRARVQNAANASSGNTLSQPPVLANPELAGPKEMRLV